MQEVMRWVAWIGATLAFAIALSFALYRERADFVRDFKAWLTPGIIHCLRGMCGLNADMHVRMRLLVGGTVLFGVLAGVVAGLLGKS